MDLSIDWHMTLPRWLTWSRRLVYVGALASIAIALSEGLSPDRTRPLWLIALSPATVCCIALLTALGSDGRLSPVLKKRGEVAVSVLLVGLVALQLYASTCARGACVAI